MSPETHDTENPSPQTDLAVRRTDDGRLFVHADDGPAPVSLRPCFPWSFPSRYLSLRDKDNRELLLVERIEDLDTESQQALRQALIDSRFTLEITCIHSIDRHFELRNWKVDTTHGPRTFQIKVDDWPRALPGGGIAISDLAGDLYTIEDRDKLDPRSRKLLFAFAD